MPQAPRHGEKRAPCSGDGHESIPPGNRPTCDRLAGAGGLGEDLAAQLRWDYDCLVSFYSGVIERVIDGNLVAIAKAHCDDGRVFDAIQHNELEEFEINECTPTEQAC